MANDPRDKEQTAVRQTESEGFVTAGQLWAVVPAAGSGTRLPSNYPKQYLQLNGRSILQRTIDTLLNLEQIIGVVVVLAPNDALWRELPASAHPKVITTIGGKTRAESVVAGLNVVCERAANDDAMVLVHDARALTAASDIERLVAKVMQAPAQGGLLATKVQDTLKRASDESQSQAKIGATVNRDGLWHAQTPQMFRANQLRIALSEQHDAVLNGAITDEACAMEHAGCSPILVEALKPNFKITRANDFDMALALVEMSEREQAR